MDGACTAKCKLGSVGQPVAGNRDRNRRHQHRRSGAFRQRSRRMFIFFVAGPQVMRGYLNRQKETDEVLDGDIYCAPATSATSTKTASSSSSTGWTKFSKIGGEMVPNKKAASEKPRVLAVCHGDGAGCDERPRTPSAASASSCSIPRCPSPHRKR